jgi:outer membrane beta-barrel protein
MLMNKQRFALLVTAFAVTSLPIVAQAQRRSPLADAPAVRKRYELRSFRGEIGAGIGTTLNQDYFHTVMANVKAGIHLTDWLSISGFGSFAVANMETGFQGRLVDSLDPTNPNPLVPREPTQAQAEAGLVKISNILGVQGEGTFFTGKYSLFGKLFASYDFYLLAGAAFLNASSQGSGLRSCDQMPQATGSDRYVCSTSGMKIGANLGVGFHSYFNNWLALNVELRDVLAQINYSGRDVNGDGVATADDASWTHTYMLGANLVVYLPTTPSISP